MPNIRIDPYKRQVDAVGPMQQRRADPAAFAGDAAAFSEIGKGLTTIGDVIEKRQSQEDAITIAKQSSELYNKYTKMIDDMGNSGEITQNGALEKINADFENDFASLGENVSTMTGQKLLAEKQSTMQQHFFVSALKTSSASKGQQAKNSFQEVINTYSSGAFTSPDTFDFGKEQIAQSVDNMVSTGMISKDDGETLKQHGLNELASGAMRGWIDKNPQYAKEQLGSGRWDAYFDGDKKAMLDAQADQSIRAKEYDLERAKRKQEEQVKTAQMTTQNQFLGKMVKGELTADDVLKSNLDPFGSGSKEQFIQMLKRGDGANRTDPRTMNEMFTRIHLPDGDPKKMYDENELNKAFIDGKLSKEDLNFLRSETQGLRTEEGKYENKLKQQSYNAAKAALIRPDPIMGQKDPLGEQQYASFLVAFNKELADGQKAGKSKSDMLDPMNKDYITDKIIRQFAKTPQEIMNQKLEMMRTKSAGSPVGTVRQGKGGKSYSKIKDGPDNDPAAWEEVK